MNYQSKSFLLWIVAFVMMTSIFIYQRMTGPTHPKKIKTEINRSNYKFQLPRSSDEAGDEIIMLEIPDSTVSGTFIYKRYKSMDEWTEMPMHRIGKSLAAHIPHQPPAGKVMYKIVLSHNGKEQQITPEPIVLRFKGHVPLYILLPHILLLVLAMFFSARAFFEVIISGKNLLMYTKYTLIFLLIGGMILGPIVQKFAFDAFWTGWPMKGIFNFGDMTDNKTLIAFIAWVVAYFRLKKHPKERWLVLVAFIILVAVYLIPHSVMGSEIDYTQAGK